MKERHIIDYIFDQVNFDHILKSDFIGNLLDQAPIYSTYNNKYTFKELYCHMNDGMDCELEVSYNLEEIECDGCGNDLDVIDVLLHMSILEHDRSEMIHRLVWFFKLEIPDNVILKAFKTRDGFSRI